MPKPHTLFEVTCRTVQGRYLLRPSKTLNDLVLGVIGRALTRHPVRLYLFVVTSNHMHLILSAPDTQTLARFMGFVNSNIAREAGRMHGWREKFWGRRYTAIPILDTASLIGRVRYILAHGCKEGLVRRPGDWPGAHCVDALTNGEKLQGTWVDRTQIHLKDRKNKSYDIKDFMIAHEVCLAPLPCFETLCEQDRRQRWREIVADIEKDTAVALQKEKVRGRHAIVSQNPHGRPAMPKRSPRPLCHVSDQAMYRLYREGYRLFVSLYRLAHERLRSGDMDALSLFPPDCYIPPFAYQTSPSLLNPG